MKVYLCGPINGRSDDDCTTWREAVKVELGEEQCVDPMRRDYRGREHECVEEIVTLDKQDIDGCEALLVFFDKPSVGTSMEVLYAWERDIPVVVVDVSGRPLSPWMAVHASRVVPTLTDGIGAVREVLGR